MDRFAIQHGKAIAMLANDGARIVTKNSDGTLTRQELAADSVFWHDGLSRLPAHI